MNSTNAASILLVRYIMPIELVLGIIGNTLNAIIFTRPALRSLSVSQYFLCSALDRLAIYPLFFLQMLADGYGIDIKTYSSSICKLLTYLNAVFSVLSPNFLVLATIDRFCLSSFDVNVRKFSVSTISTKLIAAVLIFYSVFFIHVFFMYDIVPSSYTCTATKVIYSQFLSVVTAVLTSCMPTTLFILFNILIVINIRQKRQKFLPLLAAMSIAARQRQQQLQRTDRELLFLLLVHVVVNFMCSTPYNIVSLLINFHYSQTQAEQLVVPVTVAHLLFYLNYCNSFYIYTLTSRRYRQELMKIFSSRNTS